MASEPKLILGVLPSLGGSIESQRIDRREGLFLGYYLPKYLSRFSEVRYFSYATERGCLSNDKVWLFPNKLRIHKYLYTFLAPLFYAKAIRGCSLLRVMHLNGVIPAIIAKKLFKIPFVTTYGYNYAKFAEIEGHPIKAKILRFLIPYFLKCADGIIVTTEKLKEEIESWIGSLKKARLVPNGVDTKKFSPMGKENKSRELFPFFRLLTVGRLEKQKNFFFLLDIISKLKSERSVKLTIIGRGSQEGVLREKVRQENLPVEFINHVPYESMVEHHRQADCFISTSLAEGHPKALIEAMSSGLPCVVSDCPGNSTLVVNGRNGILLKMNQTELCVKALKELIENSELCRMLGGNARQDIIQNLDIASTLERELDFLIGVIKNETV